MPTRVWGMMSALAVASFASVVTLHTFPRCSPARPFAAPVWCAGDPGSGTGVSRTLAPGPRLVGLDRLRGAALLLKGAGFLTRRPRLFWLGAVPPLIMSVIFTVLLVLVITRLGAISDAITPFADGWAETARNVVQVVAGVGVP